MEMRQGLLTGSWLARFLAGVRKGFRSISCAAASALRGTAIGGGAISGEALERCSQARSSFKILVRPFLTRVSHVCTFSKQSK